MTTRDGSADTPGNDWEALFRAMRELGAEELRARVELTRRLADSLPEGELGRIMDELNAEQTRRRADDYELTLARARASADRGDLASAHADAEAACRIDPVRWEAHALLGEILERRGDATGALRRYFTAMQLGWETDDAASAVKRLSAAA